MLDLAASDLDTVRRILAAHVPECEVRAFGSRVNGQATRHSDLDLVVVATSPLGLERMGALREAFQESDLPIRVDVMDWSELSEGFRSVVDREWTRVQGT